MKVTRRKMKISIPVVHWKTMYCLFLLVFPLSSPRRRDRGRRECRTGWATQSMQRSGTEGECIVGIGGYICLQETQETDYECK